MTKKVFEMTQEDLNRLVAACRPVRYMIIGNYKPASPQENANRAWKALGQRMGFKWDTVTLLKEKDQGFSKLNRFSDKEPACRPSRQARRFI